ncbi:MAG: energy-coupling factor transporter transmembrane protein EcfT [Candidatus Improbicoccus pseudotrichonymphae]|uniref:Energy-coupling factor transporter transmembrane protein EcfT n=1 Tax=Candidatus Improbicoccus pseudotrichonymphae TaxID=3033792 RepID=A0AA48I3T3_9FIRM|nr:MAG: energy-coupling factor transporter transmembrane protein EcfT [Candidatus Improbicoccus pseudotrichonymphae]
MNFFRIINKNNFISRIDPRIKILLSCVLTSCIFMSRRFSSKIITIAFVFFCIFLARIPLILCIKKIRFALIVLAVSAFSNMFHFSKGNIAFKIFNFSFTYSALQNSLIAFLSSLTLILICTIITCNITSAEITSASQMIFKPLKTLNLDINDIGLIFMLIFRFLPMVFEETDRIIQSQKLRGGFPKSKNLLKMIKSFKIILIPVFISFFRKAMEISFAIECKCYGYTEKRTSLHSLKLKKIDFVSMFIVSILVIGVVLCEIKKF